MAAAGEGGCVGGSRSDLSVFITTKTKRSPCPPQTLDAFFVSAPSPFLGPRSMVSFQDVRENRSPKSFYSPYDFRENGDDEWDEYFHQPEKKRRLSVDQVQFLEKSFNLENKLEPERKVQLAKDLGLQPRQIAIWFQNRRARCKSKQLEKDFDALQDSYNSLKAEYDNLLNAKDKLKAEVNNLTGKLLLKEKYMGHAAESSELNPLSEEPPQKPISDLVSEGEVSKVSIPAFTHEEISSAKSGTFDSDSPHYNDGIHSSVLETGVTSNVFEPEQSDLSQDEEENFGNSLLPPPHIFPKLEDIDYSDDSPANPCNFGFPVEDHAALWCWSY
ncbi:homeobox-leucine zipper protein HAT5-like isoform X1 [Tripterygium wilfordii]|nr:homeobox-leucine zipper protein HAT5-like isoform X1 [Tripterygium wilfordii]